MQQDLEMVMELWAGIKPFVAQKDRLDAADHIIAVLDEFNMAEGIEDMAPLVDAHLGAAIKSRYGMDIEEEEEDDEYESQY